jgi:sugar phosphate isomerase/epimerase
MMLFVYFTKTLPGLQVGDWVKWCHAYGLDGVDLAVRPGYPVNPDNIFNALPVWSETLAKAKLRIGLVTAPTNLNDPAQKDAERFFKACKSAGVSSIKIGYFPFDQDYPRTYRKARVALEGFASLARDTGVKALLHTHSGLYLGNNAAGQRLLLDGLDPHGVGSFLDTGHLALGGGPFPLELQLVKPWFSCLAIKDIEWAKGGSGWKNQVVPAGMGIVRWDEVGSSLRSSGFDGTISLHGEYSMEGPDNRGKAAAAEKAFLVKKLGIKERLPG